MTLTAEAFAVQDHAVIDIFRGIGITLGVLQLLLLGRNLLLMPALNRRVRGGLMFSILLVVYVVATELTELGRPFVIWRLPLAFVAFLYGIPWCERVRDAARAGEFR